MTFRTLLTGLGALIAAAVVAQAPAIAQPVQSGHVEAELIAQETGVAPGSTIYVALRQSIRPKWHTYWRNPGDAGEATRISWTLPPGWSAGDIVWPVPTRTRVGPLLDYAYSGQVLLPVPITAPANAAPGSSVTLTAAATYLVCEEICIPEQATVSLTLTVTAGAPETDPKWGAALTEVLAKAPKPAGLKGVYVLEGGALKLAITGAPLKGADMAGAYFFPYSGQAIDHAADQAIERGADGLTLSLTPGADFKATPPPSELTGVLALPGGAYEVTASAGTLPAGARGLGPPPAPLTGGVIGLPLALVFAFIGGLILNLMPCVFPILSMKAASLTLHAHDKGRTRLQGLAFLAGVIATFLALAGLLIALRAAGAAVGWGFQLQSPLVVAALALLMLLVALNMSGVFEIGTSVQGVGEGASGRGGVLGAFLTGALAVVVAAPCTAPFMAGALGYALTQPPLQALAVFTALALGFAAPFVLVAFTPRLLRGLPRPGPWMDVLKKGLAFPMYATAAWLAWVFSQQTGALSQGHLLAAAVLISFAAWLHGLAQTRRYAGKSWAVAEAVALAVFVVAAVVTVFGARMAAPSAAPDGGSAVTPGSALGSEPWSPERVAALRGEGKVVMVDFTADWCVTCKVNERTALAGPGVAKAFADQEAVLLKADWTRRDATIAAALAEHGRAGVPLYLVYPAKGGPAVVLPQLLTEGLVIEAIEKAAL